MVHLIVTPRKVFFFFGLLWFFRLYESFFFFRLVIGLFGLVGMAGVIMGPFVGRGIDKLVPWYATLFAIVMITLFQAIQTGAGDINVAVVVIAIVGLDVFRQMIQVSLTTAVFGYVFFGFRFPCGLDVHLFFFFAEFHSLLVRG
jgi:predicted secreted protein